MLLHQNSLVKGICAPVGTNYSPLVCLTEHVCVITQTFCTIFQLICPICDKALKWHWSQLEDKSWAFHHPVMMYTPFIGHDLCRRFIL